jgi:hypothetical protein
MNLRDSLETLDKVKNQALSSTLSSSFDCRNREASTRAISVMSVTPKRL